MKTSTPPRWYKRAMIAGLGLVAPLTACGQTDTGANAVSQPQAYSIAAKTLPDHIVNGDFEYPSIAGHATDKIMDGYAWWAYILPDEGASQTDQRKAPKTITEFDANRFGWKSLTPAVNGFHAGTVELQRDVKGDTPGMQFAEIVSELGEYAIYQDVSVQPGEHLSWSLKHAPRGYTGQRNADQMQVLIGPPGHETVSPRHPRHVERHRPNRRNGYDDHDACDRGSTIPPMGDVHGHVSGAGRRHCRPFHVQGVDLWRHERFENAQRQSGRRHQLRSDLPAHLRR